MALEPAMLGEHVRRLDADAAAAGCSAHRLVQSQASVRSGRGHLDPPILTVRSEAGVGAHLEAELLCVERDGCVLARNREHDNADVVHPSPLPLGLRPPTRMTTSYGNPIHPERADRDADAMS